MQELKLNKQDRTKIYELQKEIKNRKHDKHGLTYLTEDVNKWYTKEYNEINDEEYSFDNETGMILYIQIRNNDGIRRIYSDFDIELNDYYVIHQSDWGSHADNDSKLIVIKKCNRIDS